MINNWKFCRCHSQLPLPLPTVHFYSIFHFVKRISRVNSSLSSETDSWVCRNAGKGVSECSILKICWGGGACPQTLLSSSRLQFGARKAPFGAKTITSGAFRNRSATLQNCRKPCFLSLITSSHARFELLHNYQVKAVLPCRYSSTGRHYIFLTTNEILKLYLEQF